MGSDTIKIFFSDGSPELKKTAQCLRVAHGRSTPYRPQSNSRIELHNQLVLRGGRSALLQSDLPHAFWPYAGRHWMHSRNIEHPLDGGMSFWARRHGHEFSGHLVPFGAEIIFKPPKIKDPHLKFDPVGSRGVFLGYALNPGGRFDGDYLCAKLEDFVD